MDFDSNLLDVNLQTMDSTSIADCLEPLREFQNEDNRLDEGLPEIASGDGRTKRVKSKRPEKPPISYIALIYMAIEHQPSQRATLADIYRYLQENYQFFRSEYTGWKNSIRHNLSLNECFIKLPKKEGGKTGKGHYWAIDENSKYLLEEGCLKRRPRGYKLKTGLGGGGSSNGSDSSPTSDGSMGVQEIHGHHMNLNGSNSNESIHQDMVNQQVNGHFLLPEGSFHPDPYVYSQPPLDPLQQGQVWYQQAMEEPNVVAGGSSTEQWMTTGVQNPNFLDFSLKPEGSYLTPSLEGENGYYHTHHYYCPDPLVPTPYFYDEKNFTSYPDHLPIPQNPQIFQQNQYEQKYIFKNEQI